MPQARAAMCDFPRDSVLRGSILDTADHIDAYGVPLSHADRSVTDVFYAIFAHRPYWLRLLLLARNAVASTVRLQTTPAAETLNPEIKAHHVVGGTIGGWSIYALTEAELVVGRDNPHMDFRLSISTPRDAAPRTAVVATLCKTHNAFGRTYLAAILPFHRRGVPMLIDNAIAAGRL